MNKKICLLLFLFAMILVVPIAALGIGFPHNTANKVYCTSCHNANSSLSSNDFNNVCNTCHKSGSSNEFVKSFFDLSDVANIYNRVDGYAGRTVPPVLTRSSHTWSGSEVADQAGAGSPPDSSNLNSLTLGTTLSCARCHSVHGPRSSTINSAPFLRILNSNDEMCTSCHLKRVAGPNTTDTYGTHPINFTYTSAARKTKTNPSEYIVPPRKDTLANRSSAMKLVNGKVLCSTCHAVHYADSKSGHAPGRNSWQNLSASRGMLLRTDTFGKTAESTSVNICTNCHNKPNHQVYGGSKTGVIPIQCVDCHTGHVEYIKPEDKALGGENAKNNVYLLRRYMNYSNGVKLDSYRRKAFLTSTSSAAAFRDSQGGKAICQACHNLPPNVPSHSTATSKDQCFECHVGGSHTPGPPIDCGGCHGSPPQHTVAGTIRYGSNPATPSGGFAVHSSSLGVPQKSYSNSGVFKNESTAGHPTHAAGKPYSFRCFQCHNKTNLNHDKNTYQDVLFGSPGAYSPATQINTTNPAITTCSSVYCHSYGMATLTKGKTVSWAEGVRDAGNDNNIVKSASRCVKCHNGVFGGSQPFNNMSTNAHFRHVSNNPLTGKGITCNICHSATVSDNTTIIDYGKHVNNVRDLAIAGFGVSNMAGQVTGSLPATLNGTTACNTYCHSDGKGNVPKTPPIWTDRSTGKCNACHLTAESTEKISSAGHFKHFSSALSPAYGPSLVGNNSCSICHLGFSELGGNGNHVNGSLDVQGVNNQGCNVQCHRNAPSPIWSSGTRLECRTCHDGLISNDPRPGFNNISAPRKSMLNFSSVGHGQISPNGNSWPKTRATRYGCTECHDNTSKHVSGIRGDTRRLPVGKDTSRVAGFVGNNDLCSTCHTNGQSAPAKDKIRPTHYAFRNQTSTPTMQCARCHDVHGTANEHMIAKSISFHPDSSAYIINYVSPTPTATTFTFIQMSPPYRGLCQICHTQTNHFSRGQSDFNTSHASYNYTTNCLACHSHGTGPSAAGNVAFKPSGCNACHGYPPVRRMIGNMGHHNNYSAAQLQNYSGGGGAHAVAGHMSPTVKATEAWTNCSKCHYNTIHTMITSKFAGNSTVTRKSNVNVRVDPQYKFNANLPLDEDQYIKSSPGNSGKCSNVSCHFQKTPKWGGDDDK